MTGEVNNWFREETSEQSNLLLLASSTSMEVLPKSSVFNMVPTDADTESEPTPRQEVDICSLSRHERCLALRQNQDSSGEPDSLGDARQVGEHHLLWRWHRELGRLGRPADDFGGNYVALSGGDVGELTGEIDGWRGAGGTHLSVVTMGLGLDSVDAHIDYISSLSQRLGLS